MVWHNLWESKFCHAQVLSPFNKFYYYQFCFVQQYISSDLSLPSEGFFNPVAFFFKLKEMKRIFSCIVDNGGGFGFVMFQLY